MLPFYYQTPIIQQPFYPTQVIPQFQQNVQIQPYPQYQTVYAQIPQQQVILQPQISSAPTFLPLIHNSYQPPVTLASTVPITSYSSQPQQKMISKEQIIDNRRMIIPNQNAFVTVVPSSPTKHEDQYKSPFALQNSSKKKDKKKNSENKKKENSEKKKKKKKEKEKKIKEINKLKEFLENSNKNLSKESKVAEPSQILQGQEEINIDALQNNNNTDQLPMAEFI